MGLQEMERIAIIATLQRTGGNIKESASVFGIDRSTLLRKNQAARHSLVTAVEQTFSRVASPP
jgi:transcriptional regulator of acetoin/glycerol metabolism